MIRIMYIAVGDTTEAVSKYWTSGIAYSILETTFPYRTLSVNIIGSFFIGLFFELLEETALSPDIRMLIFVGILRAFTTFSSFSLETINLSRDG